MDWSKITSSIFEEIACLYAEDVYKNFKWIPTPSSHDNNRDGEFKEEIDTLNYIYKGWYEAKYTQSKYSIPKDHLDSTLVSGILDGEVISIIFITNGTISQNYQRRAQAMLKPNKITPHFVDGEILEEWFAEHPSIFNKYFGTMPLNHNGLISVTIEDICFFDGIMTPSALTTPLSKLQVNEEYYMYISIRSNMERKIKIRWNTSDLSVIPHSNNQPTYTVMPGFNSFMIKVRANDIYSDNLVIKVISASEGGILDKYTFSSFVIEDSEIIQLVYSNQMFILQTIFNINVSPKSPNLILSIIGKSGFGKSYLIRKLAGSLINCERNIFSAEFSEKEGENASLLCGLILFINFGHLYEVSDEAFLELIKNTINLPLEIYIQLKKGSLNQIIALNVMDKLSNLLKENKYSLITNKSIFDQNVTYIFLDDLQKLKGSAAIIFSHIMKDFTAKQSGQIMVIGYRPNEFFDDKLESQICTNTHTSWKLKNITPSDVKESILKNTSPSIAEISDLFESPINALHLFLLIRKLKQKHIEHLSYEAKVNSFQKIYVETNSQNSFNVIEKIKKCIYPKTLYLIYKLELGIPFSYLSEFYGISVEKELYYLIQEDFIKKENNLYRPFHDTYLYAFKNIEYGGKYKNELRKFWDFCSQKKSENTFFISNMLSIILSENSIDNYFQEKEIKLMCEEYYNNSQYSMAKRLAESILPVLEDSSYNQTTLNKFAEDDLKILFIYAQSIKYSESHVESDKYLKMLCNIAEKMVISSQTKGLIYEAHSELLNNAIWEMNDKQAIEQIRFLSKNISRPETKFVSVNQENAYLNLYNRKILYNRMFEDITDENLYLDAITESTFFERKDYIGYALMDEAKNNIVVNPLESINKLSEAKAIFKNCSHCRKRYLDCKSEIVFLSAIFLEESFDELYDIQRDAFLEIRGHVYAKTTLKIVALELMNGYSTENINQKLDKLIFQYPDICLNHRLHLFYVMLKSVLSYQVQDYHELEKWSQKYKKMSDSLSDNYSCIPKHNLNLLLQKKAIPDKICWYQEKNCDNTALWIDPRIW